MRKKFIVTLTSEERDMLRELISSGKAAARKLTHARILLKADSSDSSPGWKDAEISRALDVGTATIERVRKRFVEEGLEAALGRRKPKREYQRKLDGDGEAHLLALACTDVSWDSEPPEGYSRWTLRLLADPMVALEYIEQLSYQTIRRVLKKMNLNLG